MFKNKFYCITGAASGIGRATALELASEQASGLALSDVDMEGLENTAKECQRMGVKTVLTTKLDVRNQRDVESWVEEAYGSFGRLDGAANVAGVAGGTGDTTIETIVQEDWDRTLGINLNGVMSCMRAQLPRLTKPGGAIVNVASTSSRRGLPHSAAYAASKFAVIGLTESAAGEYAKQGVRINALLPGPIDTKIFRDGEAKGLFDSDALSKDTLLGRVGKAEEVAKVLCFLLSDNASYRTGMLTEVTWHVNWPAIANPERERAACAETSRNRRTGFDRMFGCGSIGEL
ncbi:hypothetical protein SAPIO_CDS7627 [Scedosporium apiospermum]|uniref:Uncharacterized protein n=1 Tax=Pseudallescheria apiosperma TaxID=563466 RepID=A0A084G2B7_PSEDA|nr:uncharacterized protein SAPIO_CDS7627 [Scedosporium apiospermum]KEZ41479.1 hypothetical protein SAPIO_CDS7627 [Scedosporium apiospermum]